MLLLCSFNQHLDILIWCGRTFSGRRIYSLTGRMDRWPLYLSFDWKVLCAKNGSAKGGVKFDELFDMDMSYWVITKKWLNLRQKLKPIKIQISKTDFIEDNKFEGFSLSVVEINVNLLKSRFWQKTAYAWEVACQKIYSLMKKQFHLDM